MCWQPSHVALPRLCEGSFHFLSGAQQHWCTTGADFFESFWQSIKWWLMESRHGQCPDAKADKSLTNQRPCSSFSSLAFTGCHSTRTRETLIRQDLTPDNLTILETKGLQSLLVPSLGYLLPYKLNLFVLLISYDMVNLPDGQDWAIGRPTQEG